MQNDRDISFLEHTHAWIRSADTKAAAVITANALLATVLVSKLPNDIKSIYDKLALSFLLLAAILICYSLFKAMSCLAPRIKSDAPSSLIFFGNISHKYGNNREGFIRDYQESMSRDENVSTEVLSQLWMNSKIATIKHKHLIDSIKLIIISIVILFIGVAIKGV